MKEREEDGIKISGKTTTQVVWSGETKLKVLATSLLCILGPLTHTLIPSDLLTISQSPLQALFLHVS